MKSNTYKPKLKQVHKSPEIEAKKLPSNALKNFNPHCVPHDNEKHRGDFDSLLDGAIGHKKSD